MGEHKRGSCNLWLPHVGLVCTSEWCFQLPLASEPFITECDQRLCVTMLIDLISFNIKEKVQHGLQEVNKNQAVWIWFIISFCTNCCNLGQVNDLSGLSFVSCKMRMIIHIYHLELCEDHIELTQVKHLEKHMCQNSIVMKNNSYHWFQFQVFSVSISPEDRA